MTTVVALAAVAGFAGTAPAGAAEGDESYAAARFLSGTVAGDSLDDILAIQGVEAHNSGGSEPVIEADTLDVSLLNSIEVTVEDGTVPLGDFVRLGAVNQYAEAAPVAKSRAAAGAVSSTGAINTAGSGQYPANATISLGSLLEQTQLSAAIDDLEIQLRAISAVAALDGDLAGPIASTCDDLSDPEHCRDYTIAGGEIVLSAPALDQLVGALTGGEGATSEFDTAVSRLVAQKVVDVLSVELPTALASLVTVDTVEASVQTNFSNSLTALVNTELSGGGVTIELDKGTITADLEALLEGSLSDLPPNTEILSAAVLEALMAQVADLLSTIPAQVGAAATTALNSASVTVTGGACLAGSSGDDCVETLLGEDIGSGFSVNVDGTLGALEGSDVDLMIKVGGVSLPADTVVAVLQAALGGAADDLVTTLVADLNTMLTRIFAALSPAIDSIQGLVSLLANVQEAGRTAGAYREVALRVTLGAAAGAAGIAQVDLAGVEVGPNRLAPTQPVVPEGPVLPEEPVAPGEPEGSVDPEEPVVSVVPGEPAAPGEPETPHRSETPTLPGVGAADTLPVTIAGLLTLLMGLILIRRSTVAQ